MAKKKKHGGLRIVRADGSGADAAMDAAAKNERRFLGRVTVDSGQIVFDDEVATKLRSAGDGAFRVHGEFEYGMLVRAVIEFQPSDAADDSDE